MVHFLPRLGGNADCRVKVSFAGEADVRVCGHVQGNVSTGHGSEELIVQIRGKSIVQTPSLLRF